MALSLAMLRQPDICHKQLADADVISENERVTATGIRMTADDLLRLPDTGMRHELVEGELHEMHFAGGEHGFVVGRVLGCLGDFLDQHASPGGGLFIPGTGFLLARNPDTVRAPDVAYVGPERLAQARVPGFPELAPDLVVEVVSPNDAASEIQRKVDEWLRAGTRLVWVLYPTTRSAMAYQTDGQARLLHADDTLTGDPVLPGFTCRVGDLF
jgi:Uma2 family endonuclease